MLIVRRVICVLSRVSQHIIPNVAGHDAHVLCHIYCSLQPSEAA